MTDISIKAADGGAFSGYLALPATGDKAPGILVIQEIFGVNAAMREICDSLASNGFLAFCPDLFWRQRPGIQLTDKTEAEWAEAMGYLQGFDLEKGISDLKSSLAWLRQHESCTGKAGTIGFCLGGKLAFLMAARSDADCNVSYYGLELDKYADEAANITKPLLIHVAAKDKYFPAGAQKILSRAVAGKSHITLKTYAADHAFARPDGIHYHGPSAAEANALTADFLATHLSSDA